MKIILKLSTLFLLTLLAISCGGGIATDELDVEINVFGIFPAGNDNVTILAGKQEEIPNEWETNDSLLFININSTAEVLLKDAIHFEDRVNIIRPYTLDNGNILFYGTNRESYSWDFSAWEYSPNGVVNHNLYLGDRVNGIAPAGDDEILVFTWEDKPYVEGEKNYDDVVIVKMDIEGDTLWTTNIAGSSYNQSLRVGTPTADGGCLALGNKYVSDRGSDMWAVRFNAAGDTLWTNCYGGDRYDEIHSIQELSDGNFLIVGLLSVWDSTNTNYSLNNGDQSYLIKLDPNGNKLWTKAIGRTLREQLTGAIIGSDGSFILCGYVRESYAYEFDTDMGWIQKLDANGELIWREEFEDLLPMGVCELSNGDIMVATRNNKPDAYWGYDKTLNVIKVSSTGTLISNTSLTP